MERIQAFPNGFETRWEWPGELGRGFMDLVKIRPGLILGIAKYRLKEDITICFEHEQPLIDLGFSLSGDVRYQISHEEGLADAYHYRYRHGTINCFTSCEGLGRTPSNVDMAYVRICATPQVLNTMLNGGAGRMPCRLRNIINGDTAGYYCHASALTSLCMAVVQQILDCPYHGPLRQMYLEGKTLELLSHALAPMLLQDGLPDSRTRPDSQDVEPVLKAEHLLSRCLENPPSLAELAREVGLNKNKLNQGFRQQFGTSVFDHLRILRLERARTLLQSGESNVTEAAFNVGYKHHGNFTRAFKKHFGTPPQEFIA